MSLDLSAYSDSDLAALRTEVNAETVRRAQLRAMPEQIRQNATDYKAMGGNTDDLIAAINAASEATAADNDSAATR